VTGGGVSSHVLAGASGTLLLNLGTVVWNFLAVLLLARLLGAHGYGAYAYGLAWSFILVVPAGLGFPTLAVREIAAANAKGDPGLVRGIIRRSWVGTAIAVCVVVGAAGAFGGLMERGGGGPAAGAFLVGLLLLPAVAAYRLAEAVLRGLGSPVLGRVAETTLQPLLLIVALVVVGILASSVSAAGAMALTVVAAAGAAVVGCILATRRAAAALTDAEPRALPSWSRVVVPLVILGGAQALQLQVGQVMLGAFGHLTASGVFSAALRLAVFVAFVQFAVAFPLAPVVTRLRVGGDRAALQRLISLSTAAASVFGVAVAAVLVLFSEQALSVFGRSFTHGSGALRILVLGELVNVASGPVSMTLTMLNHERLVTAGVVASVVANVAMAAALIPHFGIEGAAIARAVSVAAANLYLAVELWRRERLFGPVGSAALLGATTRRARA